MDFVNIQEYCLITIFIPDVPEQMLLIVILIWNIPFLFNMENFFWDTLYIKEKNECEHEPTVKAI